MSVREINTRRGDEPSPEAPEMPSLDQFRGCFLGCVLGDAIGAFTERRPTDKARTFVEKRVNRFDFEGSLEHHGHKFGQVTDDTQLTLRLMLSLTNSKKWDPEDYADAIASAFAKNQIVGYGGATQEAATRLLDGASWQDSGTPPPRAGNGAAMRAAPIGAFFWNDTDALIAAAKEQAIITHQAPMSVAGSVAIAVATAMCLNASRTTSGPHERGWWAWLERFVAREDEDFAGQIKHMADMVFKGRRSRGGRPTSDEHIEVRDWILEEDDSNWDGISPWARSSVLWSLYCLMRHPKSPWLAISLAIWGGGDTDSTASMAGALSGALVGAQAFPEELEEKGVYDLIHDTKTDQIWEEYEIVADLFYFAVGELHNEKVLSQVQDIREYWASTIKEAVDSGATQDEILVLQRHKEEAILNHRKTLVEIDEDS